VVTNAAAKPGDILILTKPLGTGIIAFASQIGRADAANIEAATHSMTTLNKKASKLMVEFGAHACTDITGFGLLGHLAEMATSSGVDVELIWDDIPLLPGVLEYAAAGILPGAIERNRESCSARVRPADSLPQEMVDICYDAQTSGGLLVAIAEKSVDKFLNALHKQRISDAAVIGRVLGKGSGVINIISTGKRKTQDKRTKDEGRATNDEARVPCCADAVTPAVSGADRDDEIAQIQAKFKDFLASASAPHGLDAYTKQAIAIALSVAMRCEPCLKMHIKNAKAKGFTQSEIDEAAWMGISFAGSPAMVFYEQFKNS
jgi:AhpD family alkylhydroperoxidase